MEAAILAGGKGTRLRPLTLRIPKPLIPVGGMALIERVITTLNDVGINDIKVVTGYKGAKVEKFLREKISGVRITCIRTNTDNTLSAFYALRNLCKEQRFLLLSCDLVFDSDCLRGLLRHVANINPKMVVAVTKNITDMKPIGVLIDNNGTLRKIGIHVRGSGIYAGGIYVCSVSVFDEVESAIQEGIKRFTDFVDFIIQRGYKIPSYEFREAYDVDTFSDIERVERFLKTRGRLS